MCSKIQLFIQNIHVPCIKKRRKENKQRKYQTHIHGITIFSFKLTFHFKYFSNENLNN